MNQIQQDFSHAYLIYGDESDKLKEKADELIIKALAANGQASEKLEKRVKNGSFSDILTIEPEGGSVKINSVRSINSFFALMPNESTMKFAVVKDAHTLTTEAQNAMLKILEEALPQRMIILLAENYDNLLPTVRSRVQKIKLYSQAPLTPADKQEYEDDLLNMLTAVLLEGSIEALFDLSAYITKDKQNIEAMLNIMLSAFKSILYYAAKINRDMNGTLKQLANNMTAHSAIKAIESVKKAIRNLKANASASLTVETMLIDIREGYNAENSRGQI